MSITQERHALYYPYIHIRDVNWLKATLLVFPQVRRIVPSYFNLDDSPEIIPFVNTTGPHGEPLLVAESPESSAVYQTQLRLLNRLQNSDDLGQFSHESAQQQDYLNSFQMHESKMTAGLTDFLFANDLAWHVQDDLRGGKWIGLHPKLGEAIMSTIAIAIARDKGLDIVTPSSNVHHAVATRDDEQVFNELVGLNTQPKEQDLTENVDDLAQVVMTTMFDFSRLNANHIAELLKDGKDLRRFKDQLVTIAARIPQTQDPDERQMRLLWAAEEVVDEWEAYKKSLPQFALEAIIDTAAITVPSGLTGLAAGASIEVVGTWTTIAVGIITYKAWKIWRNYKASVSSPYCYLSQVNKKGASLMLPLT